WLAVHSCVPVPGRDDLVIINSEAIKERCDEPLNFVGICDVSDPRSPRLISLFPVPTAPEGYSAGSFREKGGRFGPHNQHQPQHRPELLHSDRFCFVAYFNAGLQVFDISDPWNPSIAGHYIPDDPVKRIGPLPHDLVTQCEDVLVDRRGYIYMTEKNTG